MENEEIKIENKDREERFLYAEYWFLPKQYPKLDAMEFNYDITFDKESREKFVNLFKLIIGSVRSVDYFTSRMARAIHEAMLVMYCGVKPELCGEMAEEGEPYERAGFDMKTPSYFSAFDNLHDELTSNRARHITRIQGTQKITGKDETNGEICVRTEITMYGTEDNND